MVKKSNTEISNVTYNSNGDTNKTMKPMKQVINEWSHLNASNPSLEDSIAGCLWLKSYGVIIEIKSFQQYL